MTKKRTFPTLTGLILCTALSACVSGPFKINQSGRVAEVLDSAPKPAPQKTHFTVMIIPSGAITASIISDKTGTAGGVLSSMIIGPIAGLAGSFAASTAGSHAASQAEAKATLKEEQQDVLQAVKDANLQVFFSNRMADQLKNCGIDAVIYPQTLETDQANWFQKNLQLPGDFPQQVAPYRFFLQAGVTSLQIRSGLSDNTLEGGAYVRVYETSTLRQIGRYSERSGQTGSMTLHQFTAKEAERIQELSLAAKGIAQYLANGIGTDICSIMRKF